MRIVIVTLLLLLAAAAIWLFPGTTGSTTNEDKVYLQDGRLFKKNQVDYLRGIFNKKGIPYEESSNGKILIPKSFRGQCNEIVQSADFDRLSKKQTSNSSLGNPFIPPSEKDRMEKEEKIRNLESILARISGIREAVIVHDQAKKQGLSRKTIHTAFVTLWAKEGHVISQLHASTARKMVKQSFADMNEADVLVVDGDSGITFSLEPESSSDGKFVKSQVDLESTKQDFELQCKKLISEFGESEVTVRMDLEKRTVTLPPADSKSKSDSNTEVDTSEVVPNGKGEISTQTIDEPEPNASPQQKTVLIKRLYGIDVSIEKKVVANYIRQNLGGAEEITAEQFARGIVSVRNEITKAIVLWLRSQKGIDVKPDVVKVAVTPGEPEEYTSATSPTNQASHSALYMAAGGIIALVLTILVLASFKSRSPIQRPNQHSGRTPGEGRSMDGRSTAALDATQNGPTTGASDSSSSSRGYPNILTSEAN